MGHFFVPVAVAVRGSKNRIGCVTTANVVSVFCQMALHTLLPNSWRFDKTTADC